MPLEIPDDIQIEVYATYLSLYVAERSVSSNRIIQKWRIPAFYRTEIDKFLISGEGTPIPDAIAQMDFSDIPSSAPCVYSVSKEYGEYRNPSAINRDQILIGSISQHPSEWDDLPNDIQDLYKAAGLTKDNLFATILDGNRQPVVSLPQPWKGLISGFASHGSFYTKVGGLMYVSSDICNDNRGHGIIIRSSIRSCCILNSLCVEVNANNASIYRSFVRNGILVTSGVDASYVSGCRVNSTSVVRSDVRGNCQFDDCRINESELNLDDGWSDSDIFVKGASIDRWQMCRDGDHDEFIKEFCKKKRLDSTIYNYSNKEANSLAPHGKDAFRVGIELEVISDHNLTYKPSYCRIKHDGSLSEGGKEIVTRPDSADSHALNLKRMFAINRKNGEVYADRTCGMHIHVPKESCNVLSLRKRIYGHKRKYERIAGRPENEYCKYEDTGYRRQAVNETDYTVEFRLFSGTVSVHKIRRRLQWVKAICDWSLAHPVKKIKHPRMRVPEPGNEWVNAPSVEFTWDNPASNSERQQTAAEVSVSRTRPRREAQSETLEARFQRLNELARSRPVINQNDFINYYPNPIYDVFYISDEQTNSETH